MDNDFLYNEHLSLKDRTTRLEKEVKVLHSMIEAIVEEQREDRIVKEL